MAHQALNYSDQFLYALVLIRAGSVHACKRASILVNDGGALHSPQCAFRAARVVRYLSLGAMAQLVARLVRNEKVGGSNPPSSTTVMCRDIVDSLLAVSRLFVWMCHAIGGI